VSVFVPFKKATGVARATLPIASQFRLFLRKARESFF